MSPDAFVLDWTPVDGTLLYTSISRGFKAGDIPIVAANIASQERPAKQERLTAYEAGVKTTLADGHLQLNLAGFYYDYGNKQVSVLFADPIYTVLSRLDNIPTSDAYGIDADATWAITDELTASATATYVQTYIGGYLGVGNDGNPQQYKGSQFPYSPTWQGSITLDYARPISDTLGIDVLVNEHLQSKSCADLCTDSTFKINGYGLLNASIGLRSLDGAWQASLWGRNLTDAYYWDIGRRQCRLERPLPRANTHLWRIADLQFQLSLSRLGPVRTGRPGDRHTNRAGERSQRCNTERATMSRWISLDPP